MSFTPNGMNGFIKKVGQQGQTFKQTAADTLFEVISYDTDTAVIIAKRMSDGKQCTVSVSPESIARNRKHELNAKNAIWFGHLIDDRMSKIVEVGNKFIAERAKWIRNQKGGLPLYECAKIINLTDQSDNKIIQGLLTVSGWGGRIRSVQVWDSESFKLSDGERIESLAASLDEIVKARAAGGHPVGAGFQFRVVKDGSVVEVSACFDYVKDEERLPGGDDLRRLVESFGEYVSSKYEGSSAEFEVCTYKNYKASDMSKSMEANEYSAGLRLIDCLSKLDSESDEVQQGKNLAVNGVVSLTSDAVDKKSRSFIQRDMVNKVFLNGVHGNVNSFIRSPGGLKVKFADELKVRTEKPAEQKEQGKPRSPEVSDPSDPFASVENLDHGKDDGDVGSLFEELDWDNV